MTKATAVGSDDAGSRLKEELKRWLSERGHVVGMDVNVKSGDKSDGVPHVPQ